eukprot:12901997-Prorocentrum_lima.AAC.1
MYVADVMRHNSTGRLRNQPAFGELVAATRPGPKKALETRGQVGYYLYSQSWTNRVTFVLVRDLEGRQNVRHSLEPTFLEQTHTPA